MYKYPCYCFCVLRGKSMFLRLVLSVLLNHSSPYLLSQGLSLSLGLTVQPYKLASKPQGSSWLSSQCWLYSHVPPHSSFFFFFKWRMGPGDPKCRSSNLWGKCSTNWYTPCPGPFTLVLNHFYFLSITWKEMLWPMRQCHSIYLKEKHGSRGWRGDMCKALDLISCQKKGGNQEEKK